MNARLCARTCPRPQPYEIAGQPRISASSTVSPPVEWTSASAAASQSGISSVNGSTRTRASPAKSRSSCSPELLVAAAEADDLVDALHGEHLAHRALDVADAPAAAGDEHDLRAGLELERAPRVGRLARLEELRRGEAVHAVHLGVVCPRSGAPRRSTPGA